MGYSRLELNGKVAVVIGGSSGIGQVLARGLAEAGADVVPTARRIDQVKAVAEQIELLGRKSLRVTCDVTDRRIVGASAAKRRSRRLAKSIFS